MKSYLFAIVFAALISFVGGTGWYTLFGYDPHYTTPENIVTIYTNPAFWRGFLIWTFLYLFFITLPVAYLKNQATH
jgi:hypothetical protein